MKTTVNTTRGLLALVGLLTAISAVGCTSHYGGGRPTYEEMMNGDVQYYAPGPEFKLVNESAATKAASDERGAAKANASAEAAKANSQR